LFKNSSTGEIYRGRKATKASRHRITLLTKPFTDSVCLAADRSKRGGVEFEWKVDEQLYLCEIGGTVNSVNIIV
jgi:hypothetical protein